VPGRQERQDEVQDLVPIFGFPQRHKDIVNITVAVQNALPRNKLLHVKFLGLTFRLGGAEDLEFVTKPAAHKVNIIVFIPPIRFILCPEAKKGIFLIVVTENNTPGA
jgi:hypothetical protein